MRQFQWICPDTVATQQLCNLSFRISSTNNAHQYSSSKTLNQHLPPGVSIWGLRTQLIEEQLTGQPRQLEILVCIDHFVHCRATNCLHLWITAQKTLQVTFRLAYTAHCKSLPCFTAGGWATGRTSGLQKPAPQIARDLAQCEVSPENQTGLILSRSRRSQFTWLKVLGNFKSNNLTLTKAISTAVLQAFLLATTRLCWHS